ncbi:MULTISPECIES: dihydroneopterin aldolase [Ureibacillus]|jgi:dihydroneopterin aldolase|uniref:7,8-dihydroneopterin aldolase n=1 Tax=Ureibacillus thermosphaericus TaxID=51173 RepID=A0A840PUE8_URETH|nr:dihydroneopterin aldolase [Ureibacillus thermosphaericus]MBB5149527.1 dihydroneopterin aldolase [Ureibacillus thermosphaericus]NKZ32376.1 dihydroneopterin aldolase [Ureibacillus thermosphaericus]
MDYIHLRDMQFYGYHGVLPEETMLGQRFRVTVSLAVNTKKAGETDDLQYTVNYVEVYELCKSIMEGEPFQLIEAAAETIASSILQKYEGQVFGCKVELIKPDPPIPGHYKEVAVEIVRGHYGE